MFRSSILNSGFLTDVSLGFSPASFIYVHSHMYINLVGSCKNSRGYEGKKGTATYGVQFFIARSGLLLDMGGTGSMVKQYGKNNILDNRRIVQFFIAPHNHLCWLRYYLVGM